MCWPWAGRSFSIGRGHRGSTSGRPRRWSAAPADLRSGCEALERPAERRHDPGLRHDRYRRRLRCRALRGPDARPRWAAAEVPQPGVLGDRPLSSRRLRLGSDAPRPREGGHLGRGRRGTPGLPPGDDAAEVGQGHLPPLPHPASDRARTALRRRAGPGNTSGGHRRIRTTTSSARSTRRTATRSPGRWRIRPAGSWTACRSCCRTSRRTCSWSTPAPISRSAMPSIVSSSC